MSYKYEKDKEYKSRNEAQIDSLTEQYTNRGQFSYDPEADAAYQTYVKMMKDNGQKAMEDTMGKAASMTGGYGNSYAATAGQQVYNDYMSQASAAQSDFEDRALARYNAEGDNLLSKLSLLQNQESTDRANWESDYARAWSEAQAKAAYGEYSALEKLLRLEDGKIGEYVDSASRKALTDTEIENYYNAVQVSPENGDVYLNTLHAMGYNTDGLYDLLDSWIQSGQLIGHTEDAADGGRNFVADAKIAPYEAVGFNGKVGKHEFFSLYRGDGVENWDLQLGEKVSGEKIKKVAPTENGVFFYKDTIYCKYGDDIYTVMKSGVPWQGNDYDELLNYFKE